MPWLAISGASDQEWIRRWSTYKEEWVCDNDGDKSGRGETCDWQCRELGGGDSDSNVCKTALLQFESRWTLFIEKPASSCPGQSSVIDISRWWREYGKVERYRIEEKGGKCFWVTNRVGPTATNNASRANQHWVASQSLTAKSLSNVSSVKVDIETVGKFIIWQKRLILAISIIVTPSSSLAPSSSQPERQERVWREILQSGLSNLGSLNTHNALHRGGTNFG